MKAWFRIKVIKATFCIEMGTHGDLVPKSAGCIIIKHSVSIRVYMKMDHDR
jgi:hypothetical protein